ncbi:hypothetical protein PCE1_000352 [Barthelona sp. PCE]
MSKTESENVVVETPETQTQNEQKGQAKHKGRKMKRTTNLRPEVGHTCQIDPNVDFSSWFETICAESETTELLSTQYPVKGSYVLMKFGAYAMKEIFRMIEDVQEESGHELHYFPQLIPKPLLEAEEDHLEGFSAEVYWVNQGGNNELDVPLALRPTSETVIYHMFAKWIHSWRDLPMKVHQTCNVFRYETSATRPLIRTREVFWNEAHTVHATEEEALANMEQAWKDYDSVLIDQLAISGLKLVRPKFDSFPGGEHSEVLDVRMPCGRVLQTVGAHYLGQKFAKMCDIKFLDKQQKVAYPWMTCYGISTRVLAACLALNGDARGMVLPPAIARYHVVIVPILIGNKAVRTQILEAANEMFSELKAAGIRVTIDDDAKVKPGQKYYKWEMKGVPIRIELGKRDLAANKCVFAKRTTGEKIDVPLETIVETVRVVLDEQQQYLTERNQNRLDGLIDTCHTLEELKVCVEDKKIGRIPVACMDMEGKAIDERVHEATGAEIRGWIRTEEQPDDEDIKCIVTGQKANFWGYAARAY